MGRRMVDLFERAARLHDASPRPAPGLGLGQATATLAVEFARFTHEFDKLWYMWHHRPADVPTAPVAASPPQRSEWRARVYAACRVLYGPLHRRGVERGGAWYFPIAERVKRWLLS